MFTTHFYELRTMCRRQTLCYPSFLDVLAGRPKVKSIPPFTPIDTAAAERTFASDKAAQFIDIIPPVEYSKVAARLRAFFSGELGFVESSTQQRMRPPLARLAACENPASIMPVTFLGKTLPLPQTGQMWLERDLLTDPSLPGLFCITTSYRNEDDPQPGRHNLIFPMFEFETHGGIDRLRKILTDLVLFLGWHDVTEVDYESAAESYRVTEIGDREEKWLYEECGGAVLLSRFPEHTSPFWNMKRGRDGKAEKIDVLMPIETIGSAERSCDPHDMWTRFHTITDGKYAQTLFEKFGEKETLDELRYFLSLKFFPRCGGGIGMTRLVQALKLRGKL
ncbi:MAG: transposase [Parcubacteria group bacterium]|nr:transposase [Parcubacteria group bacterium]